MATKAEMAAELSKLTGEEVNPDSYKADELEAKLKEARVGSANTTSEDTSGASADTSNTQNTPPSDEGGVLAYLGPNSPAGRLVMGNTTIRRARAGEDPKSAAVKISREQFEQYGRDFDMKVVEG